MDSLFGALTSRVAPPVQRQQPKTERSQTQRLDEIDIGSYVVQTASTEDEEWRRQKAVGELDKALVALGVAFYEDYGADLDSASRDGLRRFVRHTLMLSKPSIGAQSNGRVVATWKQAAGLLSVEFLDRLRFNFALTIEGRRLWGKAHALTFFIEYPQAAAFVLA